MIITRADSQAHNRLLANICKQQIHILGVNDTIQLYFCMQLVYVHLKIESVSIEYICPMN